MAEGQERIGRTPRNNWPNAKNALAKGQSPPQELEVSPRSNVYLENILGNNSNFMLIYVLKKNALKLEIVLKIILSHVKVHKKRILALKNTQQQNNAIMHIWVNKRNVRQFFLGISLKSKKTICSSYNA